MTDVPGDTGPAEEVTEGDAPTTPGRLVGLFGPLTLARVVALVLAIGFLGGAVGWAVGSDNQPLSSTDVGFMQDMGVHHQQALEMSLVLLADDSVDPELQRYAQEIIISQRFDQGIFNATLVRFGHKTDPGETVMEWMGGHGTPLDQMTGLATSEQMDQLSHAEGTEAAALWIALMSEHHLGGMHMADWASRHGSDSMTKILAKAMTQFQRDEVLELSRYRLRNDLPIPAGFTDPTKDQRINPLSLAEG